MARLSRTVTWLGKAGIAAENTLLVILLVGMVGLSVLQIVLRNFFDMGFFWTDELLRLMVLWVAVVGAVAASRTDRHISINLVDNYLGEKSLVVAKLFVHAFSAAICALVTWFSYDFVQTSHEYGDILLGGVPAWWLQIVLPVGFGLICYRYSLFVVADVLEILGNRKRGEGE
ncbi:MAG TPA: TRAP transporter small permease subunit [Xanthomonadales bacterium]|nr:TRAP transporter small permease subunit [Xanthomonadales bacterium]